MTRTAGRPCAAAMRSNVCLERDGGRPVGGRRDEQAVRRRLEGAVNLAVVDLRERLRPRDDTGAHRAGRRVARLSCAADGGRADDGHRHAGVAWDRGRRRRRRTRTRASALTREGARARRPSGVRRRVLASARISSVHWTRILNGCRRPLAPRRRASASVAGPSMTAPVVMSNREPWHWHMSVMPVRRPPDSGHARSAQVQRSSNA